MIAAGAALSIAFLWWKREAPTPGETASAVGKPLPADTAPVRADSSDPIPAASLTEQKQRLLRLSPAEAREWILGELDSGKDYATGADLAVGSDQHLTAWPSYRTFLLDLLFQVDPAAAAQRSRELVASSASPDEWAVALRNVAKADEAGASAAWLREKSAELLRNEAWRSDPSVGYLNAFDVIVHTEHTELTPELLLFCDDLEEKAVRHASFLVVDRLTQARPEVLLPVLAETADRHPNSGPMISNLIARADLRDDVQREAVERYLLDPKRTAEEIASFAGVFPNANFHVSSNLLTRVEGIDGIDLAERDRAALGIVREWIAEERFAPLKESLGRIQGRLEKFVNP